MSIVNDRDMGRRRFLKGAGALAAGAVTLSGAAQGATTRPKNNVDYDVVVIGGGFAGITAARDCKENGQSCLVLEARNRLGGRAFTTQFEGHTVELGGAWIHWNQPFVWAERERYNLEVTETPGASPERIVLLKDGTANELTEADFGSVMSAFATVTADARHILGQPYNTRHNWNKVLEADQLSVREHLDRTELTTTQRICLESLFATAAHCPIENWSYLELLRWTALAGFNDFLLFLDASARYKLKEGTQSLIDAMLADANPDVRLSTPVTRIEDTGNVVKVVTARDETIRASAVICTVPMNVLPTIRFQPALGNEVVSAAKERHNGKGFKVYAKARGNLGSVFCFADASEPISNLLTYKTGDNHTLLVGFGVDPESIDLYDERTIQKEIRKYIPGVEIESTFTYDWVLDPYSLGTWASYKPGWMDRYYDAFQKDEGRILFASGDHGDGWRGFIDGAIAAGSKAAQRAANFAS